ncbi:Exodeoxyribonuclease VII small subunit [Rickettsiales bacterium Ac37b]|nr:Exodeoxyribonuclease VII small subunit [Rickettsiales bacterium Ac37b]
MSNDNTIENLSFEEALTQLETIVKKLESGKEALEKSLEYYELGNKLKQHCEKKLAEAQMRVDKIVQQPDGKISLQETES